MLPFLKPKKQAGTVIEYRKPDEDSADNMVGIESAMQDFCKAKDSNDYRGMAHALKAAFEILDSMSQDSEQE